MSKMNQVVAAGVLALGVSATANANQLSQGVEQAVEDGKINAAVILESQKLQNTLATTMKIAGLELPSDSTSVVLNQNNPEEVLNKKISSNEISEYLITLGIDPQELPGVRVQENQYESGQFQEYISLAELGLDGTDNFTVENISQKFEGILKIINDKYPIEFTEGGWTDRFTELSPNADEVQVLNNFIALLPAEVKPVTLANALTGTITLKKYSEMDISELSAAEKVILNANVASVLAVISPELMQSSLSLVLPKGLLINGNPLETDRTYSSVKIDKAVVKAISETGVELNIELVADIQQVYIDYQIAMTQMKDKAESQENPKRQARGLERYEGYVSTFDSMSTSSKLYVLQLMKAGQENSELGNSRLMQKSLKAVDVALVQEWDEDSMVGIAVYADYFLKHLPNDIVNDMFSSLLDERGDIMDKQLAESKETLAELDAIIEMQKQILQAKNQFNKKATLASL